MYYRVQKNPKASLFYGTSKHCNLDLTVRQMFRNQGIQKWNVKKRLIAVSLEAAKNIWEEKMLKLLYKSVCIMAPIVASHNL